MSTPHGHLSSEGDELQPGYEEQGQELGAMLGKAAYYVGGVALVLVGLIIYGGYKLLH